MGKPKRKTKRGAGRPPETDANALADKLLKYIQEKCATDKEIPILAEFACEQNILRERLYEIAETKTGERLSYALKKCIQAKEYRLEKLCLKFKINASMAIFSLKQIGWRDRFEHELNVGEEESTERALNKIADAMRVK